MHAVPDKYVRLLFLFSEALIALKEWASKTALSITTAILLTGLTASPMVLAITACGTRQI
jgi:hypothetical protein